MANTYTSLIYHFTFSTKNRVRWIRPEIQQRVWEYIGGIARRHGFTGLQIGGVDDHVHALVLAKATFSPSQIVKFLKGDSSKWIHDVFGRMARFAWQDGYGAFTVSVHGIPEVMRYIQNQHEHHRTKTFQEEYLMLLKEAGIHFDERYLWG